MYHLAVCRVVCYLTLWILLPLARLASAQDFENHPLFSSAHWGMHLIDAESKEVLYSHNASQLFVPASVSKLFTSANALVTLGPSYRFDTVVKTSACQDPQGNIPGDVYLVGGLDPTLNSQGLKELAQQLRDRGITCIHGKVFADDCLCNGSSLPVHTEWEDLTYYYAAEQSALTINDNIVKLVMTPNLSGEGPAIVTIEQDVPYCTVINELETADPATPASISITRGLSNNAFTVSGTIPAQCSPIQQNVAIHEPQEYARLIFVKALQTCGINILEKEFQECSNQISILGSISSPPISTIIELVNKVSNNLTSDLLLKSVQVTFEHLMKLLNIEAREYAIYDGSGLSRHNLISPKHTVRLLEFMLDSPFRDAFMQSLPIAGVDGTLEKRFKALPQNIIIKAKTGSMSGISNLAGYVETPNRRLIFAIFFNNSLWSNSETSSLLDALLIHHCH